MNPELFRLLLETKALEIAPANRPFWYTSGTIGPFYLNTHYLYGGREKAEDLLAFIDRHQNDRTALLYGVMARVEKNYADDAGYRAVIANAVAKAQDEIGVHNIDFVSGGERRDWFFSFMTAKQLGKPALFICKDQSVLAFDREVIETKNLAGARVLHVADLVTEASSYVRAWLPALQKCGGELRWAINVVDRGQGGEKVLRDHGVQPHHLVAIGPAFFENLRENGHLSAAAAEMLIAYHRDPRESMKRLLQEHPEVLRQAWHADDEKTRQRARLLVEQNVYGFPPEVLRELRRRIAAE